MQLKQLKLSGFKSFVDPTVVPFSSQLVAVVGPNGCGKSNIIDAVRWVMGEGSATALRGKSMADVVFNGSSNRKPVGQASVELVFDNSLGRFSGQYASYQEMSIKRLVTRDGDSFYFLNGTRCRRRDITDLFLGTGAGTRGYSIIGQNTISQLVEAKPEELRAYLEEAAGVSKYKERRRETMQRIQQTRDNLARVSDICNELETQLGRLERQAKAAERYKALKQEERQCKSDILALKWCALTREKERVRGELNQLLVLHEEHQAHLAHAEKTTALLDNQVAEMQETFQSIQTQYYQVGNDVARLQEAQQQQQREKQQVEADTLQIKADLQSAEHQLRQDGESLHLAQEESALLLQRTEALKSTFDQYTHTLQEQQQQAAQLSQRKQDIQASLNQAQRDIQVESLNQQHLERRYQETVLRLEKIQIERSQCDVSGGNELLDELRQQQILADEAFQQAAEKQSYWVQQGQVLGEHIREVERQLRAAQDKAQSQKVQHAALQASIQAAFKGELKTVTDSELNGKRLVELIQVDEQWRSACEWVLGDSLHAITLDSLEPLFSSLSSFQGQSMVWVTPSSPDNTIDTAPRLSDKIKGYKPSWIYPLHHVLLAETLEEAQAQLPTLKAEQSVMTADGFWFGPGWLRVADFKAEDESSLLLRQQALTELEQTWLNAEQHVETLQQERDKLYERQAENEREQHAAKLIWSERQQVQQEVNAQYHQRQHALEQASLQVNRLQREHDELHPLLEELAAERVRIEEALVLARHRSDEYEQQLEALLAEKVGCDDALTISRMQAEEARSALHQTELQCNREQLKIQQLNETMLRDKARIDKQTERLEALNQRLQRLNTPDDAVALHIIQSIEKHQFLERDLNDARQQVDALQTQLREVNQSKQSLVQQDNTLQEKIVKSQLTEQSLTTRIDALLEQVSELGMDTPLNLQQWPLEMTADMRESQLIEITEKIKRLGAINLMAIEEYETSLVRKKHLDDQSRDLNEALATLETAIAKMDEETQLRLHETFTQVNTLFQALFPRLFGGGQARLQLTCDNLLEAGIVVMAQPPGKRNSSIHLLSGGEKAMTAVALVFAIFQLNPSPFCMLDEVDAPLDDLNVGRFCDLVKEMSQTVQFLLITHNKVTMELAEHLIGVTMREPGVSRIVAVDVAMALC